MCRALTTIGVDPVVTTSPATVAMACAVVLPGVGAAGASMTRMKELGLTAALRTAIAEGTPFLGVCLGMQLLFGHQDEGNVEGLGVLPGRVRRLSPGVKIPQIGWNRVRLVEAGPLGHAGDDHDAYFVHSFIAEGVDPADIAGLTRYGEVFPSIVMRESVWGVQFHPEKSGDWGLELLRTWGALIHARHAAPVAAASA
ncbi:MAG: imidazole glycerol phosphate synthase subunit HisH [Thermomicrobiales bacterium]|nr:imidazole glycerol phosphate synthase subunit HisH [Thermomicrobiales bacterium]